MARRLKRLVRRLDKLAAFRLDFGRFQHHRLDQLPPDYLCWLANDCHDQTTRWIARQYLESTQTMRNHRNHGKQNERRS